jgi:adenylate cyclase
MGKEIERKFLVKGDAWRALAKGTTYRQGYLHSAKERSVRVRAADAQAFITIKGMTNGATRAEYEYEIPFAEAEEMLETLAETICAANASTSATRSRRSWRMPCRNLGKVRTTASP